MSQAEEGILRQGQLGRHGRLGYGEQVAQDGESQNLLLTSPHCHTGSGTKNKSERKQPWSFFFFLYLTDCCLFPLLPLHSAPILSAHLAAAPWGLHSPGMSPS